MALLKFKTLGLNTLGLNTFGVNKHRSNKLNLFNRRHILSYAFGSALSLSLPSHAGSHPYQNPTLPAEERVENLLELMTLDEKLSMMASPKNLLQVINVLQVPFRTSENDRLGIPPFVTGGGSRGAIDGATAFPVAMARAASWDTNLEYRVFDAIAKEAAAFDMNLLLAPVLTIVRHPGFGRAQETYGEDTFLLGAMGVPAINGIQNHVMAQVKHFALNSIEQDRYHINVNVDERTLREIYLPHFKKAVQEANVVSVMSSYNRVNEDYASENQHLLNDILKSEWGFDGFVMSDWLDGVRSTSKAVNAGLDIEMPIAKHFKLKKLQNAVANNEIAEATIDESMRRVLTPKFEWGLFEQPIKGNKADIRSEAHRALALEAARESMTLLKNDRQTLPFNRTALKKLVVLGHTADSIRLGDEGSSVVTDKGEDAVSPLAGITEAAGENIEVQHYQGFLHPGVIKAVYEADAIVVVASLSPYDEGEWIWQFQFIKPGLGGDRKDLSLKWSDRITIQLAALFKKPLVVVLQGGSAITVEEWIDHSDALLMAWYPGVKGGTAIGEALFGDINPSGKTPLSWPKQEDDLYTFGSGLKNVTYGYYQGYRYYDKFNIEPRYPFGFGLSYTDFGYSNLAVTVSGNGENAVIHASIDISNEGSVAGKEIVQLYSGYENSLIERAPKDLKGFTKVDLQPGETKRVQIDIPAKELMYWDVNLNQWHLENINYVIKVGSSSRDIRLSETVSLFGH